MIWNFTIEPNQIKEETRMRVNTENFKTYTWGIIGAYTYCWNTVVDNGIEYEAPRDVQYSNLQIGNFNSIGNNLQLHFGRNHDIRSISTGAVPLLLDENNVKVDYKVTYNQKGTIIIQNDVWIGDNVTIQPNVFVRNGAVIARNSHVVSDVPPYAVVGGNPARIIGWRYTKEQNEKLQKIQWWYWDTAKILENAEYFTEDVEGFCNQFYDDTLRENNEYIKNRKQEMDMYFAFVDYYDEYSSFARILESFLDAFYNQEKKLVLFIRDDCSEKEIDSYLFHNLQNIADEITVSTDISCSVEIVRGNLGKARDYFFNCSHYIVTRTYGGVYFSCLADQLGVEIISGVDSVIQFKKGRNMIKRRFGDEL